MGGRPHLHVLRGERARACGAVEGKNGRGLWFEARRAWVAGGGQRLLMRSLATACVAGGPPTLRGAQRLRASEQEARGVQAASTPILGAGSGRAPRARGKCHTRITSINERGAPPPARAAQRPGARRKRAAEVHSASSINGRPGSNTHRASPARRCTGRPWPWWRAGRWGFARGLEERRGGGGAVTLWGGRGACARAIEAYR